VEGRVEVEVKGKAEAEGEGGGWRGGWRGRWKRRNISGEGKAESEVNIQCAVETNLYRCVWQMLFVGPLLPPVAAA